MILTSCSHPDDCVFASGGLIDPDAPVRTSVRVVVNASPARVWKTLTDIAHWPDWDREVLRTAIGRPAAAGVSFRWSVSGGTISSHIMLFEPGRKLAWVGRYFIFRAIHVWRLDALPGGATVVTTTESLSGWPVAWFISSGELGEIDRRWLLALKNQAEG